MTIFDGRNLVQPESDEPEIPDIMAAGLFGAGARKFKPIIW